MKKIGIITFHKSHNNGSMLQALALQYVLEERYAFTVHIIDYSNSRQKSMYAPYPAPTTVKKCIKFFLLLQKLPLLQKAYNSFETFAKHYFHLTELSFDEKSDLSVLENTYDAFIAGSDQIWNIRCGDADDAYFLNFVKNKPKFAYAVSFGANNPFEIEKYKFYINDFKSISVRENNAQKWIFEATNLEVPVCLDPTMLLNWQEWENVVHVRDTPIIQGNYIFYYCFNIKEHIQIFLHHTAKKYSMPVYFLDPKEWCIKMCWRHKIRLVCDFGPDVYMNIVKNATLFLTTSFHGTAFATIYRKNFWYINDKKNSSETDDRALTFLTQLKLLSRYKTIEELENTDLCTPPDYMETESSLVKLQALSFSYLDSVAGEINER